MENETNYLSDKSDNKTKNKTMKIITRHNKQFVYEYETTPKRKRLNTISNFVNWALLLSFGSIIIGGVLFAMINLFIN